MRRDGTKLFHSNIITSTIIICLDKTFYELYKSKVRLIDPLTLEKFSLCFILKVVYKVTLTKITTSPCDIYLCLSQIPFVSLIEFLKCSLSPLSHSFKRIKTRCSLPNQFRSCLLGYIEKYIFISMG